MNNFQLSFLKALPKLKNGASSNRSVLKMLNFTENQTRSLASQSQSFENRNILQLKDRGLVVSIFPDKL
jgi:hypothetical protein